MKYGFWSDDTPCGDNSTCINEYFEGREFEHKQLGHAVIRGYAEYIEGQGNMYAIVFDRCVGIVLVTMKEFCEEMETQINSSNRLKFAKFFIRYLADGPKHYERDRAAYLKTLELQKNNAVVSSTEITTEIEKEPRKSIRIVISRSSSDDEIVAEPQCQSARTTKLTSVPCSVQNNLSPNAFRT